MSFWRKLGLVVAATLLPISLFSWGLLFSAYQMYAKPDRLKSALDTSGIYDTLVSDVLNQVKEAADQSEQKIATDQPEVKQVIERAASPEYLKTQVEGFLDGVYSWVRGETDRLAVSIDLSEVKTNLSGGLTQLAQERLATMPACSGVDTAQSFDPLTDECLPRGVDKNMAVEKIRAEIDQQFKDPVITQDDIKKNGEQSLEEKLSAVPAVYDKLVLGLWLSAGLILLCAAGIILLTSPWRNGLKRAGIIFISVGGVSVLLAIATAFALKKVAQSLADQGDLQASALNVVSLLADGFRTYWLWFGIIVTVLGIAALVAMRFIKKPATPTSEKNITGEDKPEPTHPTAEKPQQKKTS